MEEKDEIVISLSDVWNIIKKNAAFIIVVTLICAIGSFFITRYFIPKSYTSSIQLYVDTSNDDENKNSLNILYEQTYAQNLVATYIKMLNTNTFYAELSEHINNKYTPKQLSKMVSFSSDEKTEIFDAKVTTSSPNDSKLIADAVGKVAPEAISRLKSKATLKIVDYAQLPTAPSSPNEIKNVIIAMIAGLMIIPAVFAFSGGDAKTLQAGSALMFITIPKVFASMGFGTFAGVMFFLLVLFAALTSSIALTESAVSTFEDEFGWNRRKSTVIIGVIMLVLGSLSALGYGFLADVKIIGMQFLDFFDFLTNTVMMPIAAIATCLFVSRVVGVKRIEEEVTYGGGTFRRKKIFCFMIKYLCPIFAALILLSSIANAFGWISM